MWAREICRPGRRQQTEHGHPKPQKQWKLVSIADGNDMRARFSRTFSSSSTSDPDATKRPSRCFFRRAAQMRVRSYKQFRPSLASQCGQLAFARRSGGDCGGRSNWLAEFVVGVLADRHAIHSAIIGRHAREVACSSCVLDPWRNVGRTLCGSQGRASARIFCCETLAWRASARETGGVSR